MSNIELTVCEFQRVETRFADASVTLQRSQSMSKPPPVSRTSPAPPYLKRGLNVELPSPPNPPLKPSYSQIVKTKIPPRDPEKKACDQRKGTRDVSCDLLPVLVPRDQPCDPTRPRDPTCFGHATRPLINTWKTVGINQLSTGSKGS